MEYLNEMPPIVHPGQFVLFTITEGHAKAINDQRTKAGYATKTGNQARAGDVYPVLVVRVWNKATGSLNGQMFLDGNDAYWLTSVEASPTSITTPEPEPGTAPQVLTVPRGAEPSPGCWHLPLEG